MALSGKSESRKTTTLRKNVVSTKAAKAGLNTSTLGRQTAKSRLENAIEAGKLLDNLAKLQEIRADTLGDVPSLKAIQKSILTRLLIIHGVERSHLAPESCRDGGRLFSVLSLEIAKADDLVIGEMVPAKSEVSASGAFTKKISEGTPEYDALVTNTNPDIVFKDEEGTGADRRMTKRLKQKLDKLATFVAAEWSGVKLRVTEAWDEDDEHAGTSLHYEGRAADLTTNPLDAGKLGRLGRLAVDAGFDWVLYENSAHIHVSVTK